MILPTYSERATLPGVVARILAAVPTAEILVVDDNSPDATGEWAEAFAAKESRVNVINRAQKEGLGPAYIAGFDWALSRRFSVIVEMDADGSHQPEELPALLEAVANGADLAIGTRWIAGGSVENWPRYRQFISRAGTRYARALLGSRLHDLTSGYRAFSRDALESLDLSKIDAQGYAFQIELAWHLESAGATIVEVPITFVERLHGRSKMSSRIVVEAFLRVTGWRIAGRNTKSLTTDKSSAGRFR